jgi:hypothetical protein
VIGRQADTARAWETEEPEGAVVRVGSRVRVEYGDGDDEFAVVAPEDADAMSERVSAESPIGRALLGRRVGERVRYRAPEGVVGVTVLTHLVGQSRAFVLLLEDVKDEIGTLHDERAAVLVEGLELALRAQGGPGTLRHVEAMASGLLRSIR